jgi:hypothetical protein
LTQRLLSVRLVLFLMPQRKRKQAFHIPPTMPLFHDVEPSQLQRGDHIYVYRTSLALYQHHGIVLTKNQANPMSSLVLEMNRVPNTHEKTGEITSLRVVSLDVFVRGDDLKMTATLRRAEYSSKWQHLKRSGTAFQEESDTVEVVLARANKIQQCPHDYFLVTCNCEHLAFYCKTGKWQSSQVDSWTRVLASGIVAAFRMALPSLAQEGLSELLEAASKDTLKMFASNFAREGVTGALAAVIVTICQTLFDLYNIKFGKSPMTLEQFFRRLTHNVIVNFTGAACGAVCAAAGALVPGIGGILAYFTGAAGTWLGRWIGERLSAKLDHMFYAGARQEAPVRQTQPKNGNAIKPNVRTETTSAILPSLKNTKSAPEPGTRRRSSHSTEGQPKRRCGVRTAVLASA